MPSNDIIEIMKDQLIDHEERLRDHSSLITDIRLNVKEITTKTTIYVTLASGMLMIIIQVAFKLWK